MGVYVKLREYERECFKYFLENVLKKSNFAIGRFEAKTS